MPENGDNKGNNKKPNKPDSKVNSIQNKDTGIGKKSGDIGRFAGDKKKDTKKPKEKSINEMGGKGVNPNDRSKENTAPSKRGENENPRNRNRRREKGGEPRQRDGQRRADDREKDARDKKVQDLRDRRRAVQKYMDVAKNSDNPLGEINWADKHLKAKDRRKLREILQSRGFSDNDIYKDEKKDINQRIKDNKKENLKTGVGVAGDVAGLAGTGGLSIALALPGLIIKSLKMRKNNDENKKLKKSLKWRRILLILPTILIALGLMLAGWLIVLAGSQFVGTMLSHPEAIKELHEAGTLGDAMYLGNVTEDVVVDGEVIVKGNPKAQPGCFVYNGVWYCGGCLTTGGTEPSSNTPAPEGTGEVTGNLAEPMKSPYQLTSNFGSRWGSTHKGIDLVGKDGDLAVYAADGGTVSIAHGVCAPGSGYYPNPDPTCGGWGNYVEIKHEGQKYKKTLYAHLDYVDVKVGDKVDKGQKLGTMGHTGNSTGAHLHFEIWESDSYGSQVDPRNYIPTFPKKGQMKQ